MTELKITQADRAAAVDIMLPLCRDDYETAAVCKALLGECDDTPPVQAFARHRIAAEEGKAELVEALERIEGATMSMYFKPADMVQDIKRMAAAALARVRGEG